MSVDDDIVTALRELAVTLDGGSATKLPAPLETSLDDARIVGLGESTHGTRECFEQKRRLIQHLVVECGFRTVAIEADVAATTALDAFVRDAESLSVADPADAASALAELEKWQWRTESVRDLLGWLRSFNAGRPQEDQVRLRGVDLSTPGAPAEALRGYLERVDSPLIEFQAVRTVVDATGSNRSDATVSDESDATVSDDPDVRERALADISAAARTLAERLSANRATHVDASTPDDWATARHLCRVIEQACGWSSVRHEHPGPHSSGMATRDRFMAENALWALERDPGAGVALWAHDGHVQRGTFDDGTVWADATTMGERLARELDDWYRPVGFDFVRGSFRAVDADHGDVDTFAVDDPIDDSATVVFAAIEDAPFLLDLRSLAREDRLCSWLGEPRRKRHVGSVFDPDAPREEGYARTDLPASFDWILVLPDSSPSRPIGAVRKNP